MLKETETEETIVFFVTFLSSVAFQWGEGRAPCHPPWLRLCSANFFHIQALLQTDYAILT